MSEGISGWSRGLLAASIVTLLVSSVVTFEPDSISCPIRSEAFASPQFAEATSLDLSRSSIGNDTGLFDLMSAEGLEFSTYFGGNGEDETFPPNTMTLDSQGNIYICGDTNSTDLPVTDNAFCQTLIQGPSVWERDCFVAKFNHNASELLYCTYYGGSHHENVKSITVDDQGRIYAVGMTYSDDFPTTGNAYDTTHNGYIDGYLVVLDTIAGGLVYSSFYGTEWHDDFIDVEVDSNYDVVIVGDTNTSLFPTTQGAYCRTVRGPSDFVILKTSIRNGSLMFSTFLGGSGIESIASTRLMLTSGSEILLIGVTESDDFPVTTDAYDKTYNGETDTVICRLSSDGTDLLYSSYFGGSDHDYCFELEADGNGDFWLFGQTGSYDLPVTPDAYQAKHYGKMAPHDHGDGLIARFDETLSTLEYCTYLGTETYDIFGGFTLYKGAPVVFGYASQDDWGFPTTAWDHTPADFYVDVFVVWLDVENNRLLNGTHIGGTSNDYCRGITVSSNGALILFGKAWSADYPTAPDAYQASFGGMEDLFLTGLDMEETPWDLPTVPLNFRAEAGDRYVDLTWDPPRYDGCWRIDEYNVTVRDSRGFETTYAADGNKGSITIDDLTNGELYEFRISAITIVGEGPRAGPVYSTPFIPPSMPQDFKVTTGHGNLTLTWYPPLGSGGPIVKGYRITRGLTTTSLQHMVDVDGGLSYVDEDVDVGTRYYYQVRAFHEFSDGIPTGVVSGVPYGPPGPPEDVIAASGDGTVTLTWSPPANDGYLPIDGYKVFRGTSPEDLKFHKNVLGSERFVDTEVAIGYVYYYAVTTLNRALEGDMSAIVQVMVVDRSDPPLNLRAIEGDGQVTLVWDPPFRTGGSPLVRYEVLRGDTQEGSTLLGSADLDTTYDDTGLENGKSYYYSVRGVTDAGAGWPSEVISATPMGPPEAPGGFTVVGGEYSVELIWLPPVFTGGSDLVVYHIYRGLTPDEMTLLADVPVTSTRFIDYSVSAGVTYHYLVTASNARVEGLPTDVLSTIPSGLPTEPMDLSATPLDGGASLAWKPPINAGGLPIDGYNIYVGTREDDMRLDRSVSFIHTFVLEGLENGATHLIAISAVNELGEGPICSPVKVLPLGPPGSPMDLVATAHDSSVSLSWAPPSEDGGSILTSYIMLRGTSLSDLVAIIVLGDITSYTDVGLEPGTTYFYAMVAKNGIGESGLSNVAIVTTKKAQAPSSAPAFDMWFLIFGVLLVMMVAGGAVATTEPGKYRLALLFAPLLTKKEDVLDNKTRYLIHGIIAETPGIHYTALKEELELPNGVAVYHLNVLEKEEFIRSIRDGRLKRFYSTDSRVPDNLQMTPHEIREAIIQLVRDRPGISQKRIINELGVDRDSVGYFLRELVKEGQLDDSREGRYTVYRVREG